MTGEAETSGAKTSKDPQRGSVEFDELIRQIHELKEKTSECLEDAGAAAWARRQHMKPKKETIKHEPKEAKKRGRPPGMSKNKANSSSGKAKKQKIHPAIAFGEIVCGFYQDENAKRYIMEKAKAAAMETAAAGASASIVNNKNKKVQPRKLTNSTPQEKAADHQDKEYKKRGRPKKITKQPEQSLESELSNLQAEAATNEVMKNKKRGRPRKIAQQPQESLKLDLRNLEEELTGCEPKKEKGKSGWPKHKPRNPQKRLIWEQQQVKEAAEKAKQQLPAEIELQQPDLQQQNQEMPQQGPEIAEEEAQPPFEIHERQPETEEEIQLEEEQTVMKTPEEPRREIDGNKNAICAVLANIMLQMTKITGELAKLITMVSGGSQKD